MKCQLGKTVINTNLVCLCLMLRLVYCAFMEEA